MNDRAQVQPRNVIPVETGVLCLGSSFGAHIYDAALWADECPCGSGGGIYLKNVLGVDVTSPQTETGAEGGQPLDAHQPERN